VPVRIPSGSRGPAGGPGRPGPPDDGGSDRRAALLAATEPVRALADAGSLALFSPLLVGAPRGERHPVLVLPGLMASDLSTLTLRTWLRRLGYAVVGWELGRNRGPTREVVDGLPALVDRLAREHRSPVSIVGWSLGGIFARSLALRAPLQVRQVVTLGSPFGVGEPGGAPGAGARVYRALSPWHAADRINPAPRSAVRRPLPVPSTSVYSRNDGVVDWRACLQETGPTAENVAVRASHLGMGTDPATLWVVADRLAQPRGGWRPFTPPARLRRLFPDA
jgi:pimeloyl-ACP methyl ester carboxylesterase